ncbi:MAG: hypothetical protein AAB533_03875 [Patescibacteria group bacterium]
MAVLLIHHPGLSVARWQRLSLAEQLGNVGSEIGRARRWKNERPKHWEEAAHCALELLDLTIQDPRWQGHRRKELLRARECVGDAYYGGGEYGTTFEDLDRYFLPFALSARMDR